MGRKQDDFDKALARATNYKDWYEAAAAYDAHHGLDDWRLENESDHYDYRLIASRVALIRKLRRQQDYDQLVFRLREELHGNLGNIANPEKIANPDNVFFSNKMRTLFVGEDSGTHVNNFLWAYNVDTGKLTRILSQASGAESTGLQGGGQSNGGKLDEKLIGTSAAAAVAASQVDDPGKKPGE